MEPEAGILLGFFLDKNLLPLHIRTWRCGSTCDLSVPPYGSGIGFALPVWRSADRPGLPTRLGNVMDELPTELPRAGRKAPFPIRADATQASFHLLGCTLQMIRGLRLDSRNRMFDRRTNRRVRSRRSPGTLRDRILPLIRSRDIVRSVNRSPRGWANYRHSRNSSLATSKVGYHGKDRSRIHLRKRHKGKDLGADFRRFPRARLYRRHGLYKVATKAGSNSTNALA